MRQRRDGGHRDCSLSVGKCSCACMSCQASETTRAQQPFVSYVHIDTPAITATRGAKWRVAAGAMRDTARALRAMEEAKRESMLAAVGILGVFFL